MKIHYVTTATIVGEKQTISLHTGMSECGRYFFPLHPGASRDPDKVTCKACLKKMASTDSKQQP